MAAYSGGYDFLLCDLCGTFLTVTSHKYAKCSVCGSKKSAKASGLKPNSVNASLLPSVSDSSSLRHEILGKEVSYRVTTEDIRRELKTAPFVKLKGSITDDVQLKRTVIDMPCQKCKHPQLEYYTGQSRGADEGQTVYYQCPNCGEKRTENT